MDINVTEAYAARSDNNSCDHTTTSFCAAINAYATIGANAAVATCAMRCWITGSSMGVGFLRIPSHRPVSKLGKRSPHSKTFQPKKENGILGETTQPGHSNLSQGLGRKWLEPQLL
eukprot:CAMPEP_0117463814 /NCGR_PEP_ID=MMETSP0784-20121206/3776_1 /TAXON_ID=39447 /ORGANISM="" /LENGTH=115 /DNA_ID=CAMNT_0005257647 /DNA_START=406 /DNA_END=750 /DNA_ORIENTATION=+